MNLAAIFSFVALLCYLALVAVVALRRGARARLDQLFVAYLMAMAFWQVSALIVSVTTDARVALYWYKLMAAGASVHLIVYFFFVRAFIGARGQRKLVYIGYVACAITVLLSVGGTSQIIESVYRDESTGLYVPQFGAFVYLLALCGYFFLGQGIFNLLRRYKQARSNFERNRLKYLILGISMVVLGTLANFSPLLRGYPIDIVANALNAILIAYAILRYQLLDITVVVRKGLLYSIPTAVLGAGYFLIVYLAVRMFRIITDYQVLFLSLVVAAVTALVSEPLRKRLQSGIDKVFFRETYNSRLMLQRLSGVAVSILDLNSLTGMILNEVVTTMHMERAAFLLKEERSGGFRLIAQKGLDSTTVQGLRKDHPIIEWLSSHKAVLTRRDVDVMPEFRALWRQERDDLERMGADLFIPMRARGEMVVGVFVVGPKLSEESYSQDDELTLATLANQVSMAIQNAQLYEATQQELIERKRAEQQIKASLREKEVLLKEIHHRVKNNLQVISSLLYLQSGTVDDEQALQMFRDSQTRIRSIALVHERLYQSKDLARIDFAEYIRRLASYVFRSYGASSRAIKLAVDADDVFLGIDVAVPWALLINELLSNALKHAFPNGKGGEIRVELRSDGDDRLRLTVRDNGVGFPEDLDFRNTKSLGLQLVNTLVEQLEGTVDLDRSDGTAFRIAVRRS